MANEKTRVSQCELEYLIFDIAARCKDKDGGTIHMRQCLMALQELQASRADQRDLIHRVCEASGGTCMAFHELAELGPCSIENCNVYRAAFSHSAGREPERFDPDIPLDKDAGL